jgi:hypothetical protein
MTRPLIRHLDNLKAKKYATLGINKKTIERPTLIGGKGVET